MELSNETTEPEIELLKYVYPAGSPLDLNPLYVLCCNDTCSFTWTKDKHINQDIYECKTCNLTETLCCCSECARTCHAGHDCVLKKTSPTAYCDCLEKCPCRSQEEGDQDERSDLLEALLMNTSLVEVHTSKGEHLLQFLAQTVARQVKEQTQGKETIEASRSRATLKDEGSDGAITPPIFCRSALTRVLRDRKGVNSMIMNKRDQLCASYSVMKQNSGEEIKILENQKGSARLDKFSHTLLLKLNATEYLNSLIGTIQTHSEDDQVAERFVRSIVRVFICFSAGIQASVMNSEKQSNYIKRCKKVFQALPVHSAKELSQAAESLIRPMRLGATRPVEAFSPTQDPEEIITSTEDLFSIGPMAPKKEKKPSRTRNRNRTGRVHAWGSPAQPGTNTRRAESNWGQVIPESTTHQASALPPRSSHLINFEMNAENNRDAAIDDEETDEIEDNEQDDNEADGLNESEEDEPLPVRDGLADDSHDGFGENEEVENDEVQAAIEDVTNEQRMEDEHHNFEDDSQDMIENLVTDENTEEMDVDESSGEESMFSD